MFHQFQKRKNKFRAFNRQSITAKIRHADFAALIYIRNTNIAMNNDLKEILQILKEQQMFNRKSRLIFKTNCKLSQRILWEGLINNINDNLNNIKLQIEYVKENTIIVDRFNHFLFWNQNKIFLSTLKRSYQKLEELGDEILPEDERSVWKTEVCTIYDELLYIMVSLLNICKIELDFIKTHTPHNLKKVMQNVIEDIPKITTLREKPHPYNSSYLNALEKYKTDFGEKRSFRDVLLKVFTMDTRKSPSEFVMLGRWIDGKNKKYINSM